MHTNTIINTSADVNAVLNTLVVQRQAWEQGTYAASNRELYALLAQCFDLMLVVKGNVTLAKGLNSLLRDRNVTFNKSTSLGLKIARAVFADSGAYKASENRLYTYARVLMVALETGQTAQTLANFIQSNGGIDEVRRKAAGGTSPTERKKLLAAHAEQQLAHNATQALIAGLPLSDSLQPAHDQHFSLALVRKEADGTGSIVFGTSDTTLVAQMLTLAGKQIDDAEEQQRQHAKQQQVNAQRAANQQSIAQQITQTASQTQVYNAQTVAA